MTTGGQVTVARQGEHRFRVEVVGSGVMTSHTVEVPRGLADELGWGDADESELVRESLLFLLEREPASCILGSFGLDVISRYFPEYESEIRRRRRLGP
jgi:hypothetical protein